MLERMGKSETGKKWISWMEGFFCERRFQIEWNGEKRGLGTTNVGVPQGSPLSPIIFLIFMAPILEEMETIMTQELNIHIEIPSYVGDILCTYWIKRDRWK